MILARVPLTSKHAARGTDGPCQECRSGFPRHPWCTGWERPRPDKHPSQTRANQLKQRQRHQTRRTPLRAPEPAERRRAPQPPAYAAVQQPAYRTPRIPSPLLEKLATFGAQFVLATYRPTDNAKLPIHRNWQTLQPTAAEAIRHLTSGPTALVGIIPGSLHCVVVDVDRGDYAPLCRPEPARGRLPQPTPRRPAPLLPTTARDRFTAHRTLIPPRGWVRHIGGRPLYPLIRRHLERPERPQPPEGRIPEPATPGSLPSPIGAAEKLQSTSRRQRLLLLRRGPEAVLGAMVVPSVRKRPTGPADHERPAGKKHAPQGIAGDPARQNLREERPYHLPLAGPKLGPQAHPTPLGTHPSTATTKRPPPRWRPTPHPPHHRS